MSDQSAQPPEEETTILVGGMTGEEFLGLPERVDFVPAPTTDQQAFLDATRERGRMSKQSQIRSATPEDTLRLFGSGRLMIGFPVRPPDWRPPSSGNDAPQPTAEQRVVTPGALPRSRGCADAG